MNENPQYEYTLVDHFLNSLDGDVNWINTLGGGTLTNINSNTDHPGIMQVASASAATDTARVRTAGNGIQFSGGAWIFQSIVRTPTLSTAAQEFIAFAGFFDTTTNADAVDGAYFEYDRATGGDFWRTATANNSARTKNTTGVAIVAATFYYLKIVVSPSANQVEFYINDALQFTHTTNIPTAAARVTGMSVGAYKTVGTTSTAMLDIDFIWLNHKLNVPLW